MIVLVTASSNLVLTRQIYSEETLSWTSPFKYPFRSSLTRPLSLVEHIGMGLALGVACEPLEGACDDIPKKFWEFPALSLRLQHSPYFCVFSQKKGLERGWKQRARLEREAKKYGLSVLHTLYSIELPASPSYGQFPLAKFRCKLSTNCQVVFSTSHSRYSVEWWIPKAFTVKWLMLIELWRN